MEKRFSEQLKPWQDAEWVGFKGALPKIVLEDLKEIADKNDMALHELIAVAVLYWYAD